MSDPFDANHLLAAAERIVAKASQQGADEVDVYMVRNVSLELSIENNAMHGAGRSRTEGGGIRVIKDGRAGFAYFTNVDDAPKTIDRALAMSRLSPVKGLHLPEPQAKADLADRWDGAIAELDVDAGLALANRLLDARADSAADTQLAGGGVSMGFSVEALANHNGIAVCDRATDISAGVNLVMEHGESALNTWDSLSAHTGELAPEPMVEALAKDLRSLRDPQPASGGIKDVIFRPAAVSELITGLVVSAVDGDDAMRGKTVWSDRLGDAVAATELSIIDDPTIAGAVGVGTFDGDGLPAVRLPIIEDGILRNFLFDVRDGHDHGRPSTHSAVRGSFKSPPGVGTQHLVVSGKNARSDDTLIASVDDGYLVESVLGAHTANATTGDFSVSAPNVWRIEGGSVVGAASEIAIGGNLPDILQRLDGVGKVGKQMDGARVPMLRFRDIQVSS